MDPVSAALPQKSSKNLRCNSAQEDPRSKKFSTQYDYSLHSVPMKSSGHFSKTGDAIKKIGSGASKHHRKRRHRRNKHNRLETEDINPSDVVAEILGNFL